MTGMDFLLTDDERLLTESVQSYFARESQEADRWPALAELGWLAASLPEAAGGLGWGARAAAIIAEGMGKAGADDPFVEVAVIAAQTLTELDDPGVAHIASGEDRTVIAHNEAEARGNPDWIGSEALPVEGGYHITGTKHAIVGGAQATRLIASAMVPGHGATLFDIAEPTRWRRDYAMIDGRQASDFRFEATPVPAAAMIGPPGGAAAALARGFDHGLVLSAAKALGTMQAAFDLTRTYLLTRRQYGQLIGDFQALRHRLADMFIALEQARSMVARGLIALDAAEPAERARMAAATKAKVGQAGLFVTGQAIQLHGGIGVTEEYPVGQLYTRMVVFENQQGSASVHIRRYAQMVALQ